MNVQTVSDLFDVTPCGGNIEEIPPIEAKFPAYIRYLLRAMQATTIPAKTDGLWEVRKHDVPAYLMLRSGKEWQPCTELFRCTAETLHLETGELVMTDHWLECSTHLEFILKSSGRVLVTGLGLGCVVRGLLAHRKTSSITVIERDTAVIKLVSPHIPMSVNIIHADVRDWIETNEEHYDYAWHDLWSDPDKEEPNLQVVHAEILSKLRNRVRHQGAWKFPRMFRTLFERNGGGLKRQFKLSQVSHR